MSVEDEMRDALALFTEFQLATLEAMEDRKRTSRYDLRRQQGIVDQMVDACRRFGVKPGIYHGRQSCQRLAARMEATHDR